MSITKTHTIVAGENLADDQNAIHHMIDETNAFLDNPDKVKNEQLVLDMKNNRFIASHMIRHIERINFEIKGKGGQRISIKNVGPDLYNILAMTGADKADIEFTLAEGVDTVAIHQHLAPVTGNYISTITPRWNNSTVISFFPEAHLLDLNQIRHLDSALSANIISKQGNLVILDMTNVQYGSQHMLEAVVKADKSLKRRGGKLVLTNITNPGITQLFEVVKRQDLLSTKSVDELVAEHSPIPSTKVGELTDTGHSADTALHRRSSGGLDI